MRILLDLLAFLTPYGTHSYFLMFGILLACGAGFPMPEDIVLVTGGILSSRAITNLWMVIWVCMAGVLMGDGIVFMIGRYLGPSLKEKRLFKKILNEKNDQRVARLLGRYGDKVVFMARFMPGLRMPIFMTTGIYRVPIWKFFLLDGLAALISVPLWVYVGYLFGSNLEVLEAKIHQFQFGIYAALGVLIAGFVAWVLIKKRIATRVA